MARIRIDLFHITKAVQLFTDESYNTFKSFDDKTHEVRRLKDQLQNLVDESSKAEEVILKCTER